MHWNKTTDFLFNILHTTLHSLFYLRDDVSRFASTNSFWNDPLDGKANNDMGMCIAVDPRSYNYRWNTKYCNGPDTASFVCQIPGKKYSTPSLVLNDKKDVRILVKIFLLFDID